MVSIGEQDTLWKMRCCAFKTKKIEDKRKRNERSSGKEKHGGINSKIQGEGKHTGKKSKRKNKTEKPIITQPSASPCGREQR